MRALVACALSFCFCARTLCGQHRAEHSSKDVAARTLALKRVSLYKNGVGFFEHEAEVRGDARLELDLSSAQLNDALNTLTMVDLDGGHLLGAHYGSATPLAQHPESLGIQPGVNPTQESLLGELKGARVEISGVGNPFTGRLLSLEVRAAESQQGQLDTPEQRLVTVIGEGGAVRTVKLDSRVTLHFLEPRDRTEVNGYLQLLEQSRQRGVRRLELEALGTGTRRVQVSYLSEAPVWKSTYRFLLHGAKAGGVQPTVTVQGFSVVDNTTDEDWQQVKLALVAGAPQSFVQPIAAPVYDRRPEVAVAENGQTTPQTHDSEEAPAPPPPPPPGSASADIGSAMGGNPASLFGSPTGTGMGSGMVPHAAAVSPEQIAAFERSTFAPQAIAHPFDDFFAYELKDPVTIPRHGSALVPTLAADLPVERVTLWSPAQPQPLRTLWITNTSGLTLDRGSFAVTDAGSFAGQGLLAPVHAGERRLLSYAVDEAVSVVADPEEQTQRVSRVIVNRGVVVASEENEMQAVLRVSNAAPDARTVLVEQPRRPDWVLEGAMPVETTGSSYRFRVALAPHESAKLVLRQKQLQSQRFALANSTEEQLREWVRNEHGDVALLAPLQPVFRAQRRVAELDEQIVEVQAKERALHEDGERVRKNLQVLKNTGEERELARRYLRELNAQEDAWKVLKQQEGNLQQQRTEARRALASTLSALEGS